MSNSKISALTSATTPLAGTETLPVVQSSTTKQVSVANLTAGRAVSALSVTTTSDVTVNGADTAYVYAYNPTAASGGVPKSSPRVGFYGSEWNSGAGAVSMSGYWQLQALANNVASPTSKLSLYLAGNGGTPAEVLYFGSDGNSVSYGSVTYTLAGGGNVTLENTTAATSATPQPSGKLILNSRSWNSANGNVGQTSYIRAITSTNNANPTVESIALAPSNGAGGQNEYFIFKGNGDQNLVAGNLIQGTANKGFNFTANTPTAGMTSQLLNWYEEGTWTPNQGSGLTVVGTFSSTGRYTRIGKLVTVHGSVNGSTSVAVALNSVLTSNLPFTVSGVAYQVGSSCNNNVTAGGQVMAFTGSTIVYSVTTIAASLGIYFSVSYTVA